MMHKEPAGFRNQLRNRFCNRLQKELGKDFQNRAPAGSLQSRELVPAWELGDWHQLQRGSPDRLRRHMKVVL